MMLPDSRKIYLEIRKQHAGLIGIRSGSSYNISECLGFNL